MYDFVKNMNKTFFCIKIHDNLKSYFKALKKQKKNKKYKFLTLTEKKFGNDIHVVLVNFTYGATILPIISQFVE